MYVIVNVILGLLAIYSGIEALYILKKAESVMHQIYGSIDLVVFATSVSGIGIISAIKNGLKNNVVEPEQ